jgi:cytochrome b subunit of formate dehydrogenase
MSRLYTRFSVWQRVQHGLVIVLFTALCVTGLPQKFFESGWAIWLVELFGGIDRTRWLHRATGILFTGLLVAHVAVEGVKLFRGRGSLSMIPHRRDFADAILTLRYYLGLSDRQARFDRFDYKQKFEYWGLVLGSLVVVGTGLVLLYPVHVTQWLPGVVVPVAMVAHSNEGLLAFLTIITWHVYSAVLAPEVFPLDTTMFTGTISEERMRHEHPLEWERLHARGEAGVPEGEVTDT